MKFTSHFYAMVDPLAGHDPVELAGLMLDAGARVLQLRLKDVCARDFLAAARAVAALCRKADAIALVNDRVDIAMLSGAAGVHLGQTDLPLKAARKLMGPGAIIGISTAGVEQAAAAEAGGADYIGFGPMYPGGAKQNSLARAWRCCVRCAPSSAFRSWQSVASPRSGFRKSLPPAPTPPRLSPTSSMPATSPPRSEVSWPCTPRLEHPNIRACRKTQIPFALGLF